MKAKVIIDECTYCEKETKVKCWGQFRECTECGEEYMIHVRWDSE